MECIGIRQLKEHMSEYMRKVKGGQSIMVTERNKEIAIIMPIDQKTDEAGVHRLIAEGRAEWSGGKPRGARKRVELGGDSVSDAVIEDRR